MGNQRGPVNALAPIVGQSVPDVHGPRNPSAVPPAQTVGTAPDAGAVTSGPLSHAMGMLGNVNDYLGQLQDWRAQRPGFGGIGDNGAMADWRSQRPHMFALSHPDAQPNALAPSGPNTQFPLNPNPPQMMPPVMMPGGGTTGAPLQGYAVQQQGYPISGIGSSYTVPGMTMPTNPYGMPTY